MRKVLMSVVVGALALMGTLSGLAAADDVRKGMVAGDAPVAVTYAVNQGVFRKTRAGETCYLRPGEVVDYHGVLDGKLAVRTTLYQVESIVARFKAGSSKSALPEGEKWCKHHRFVHIGEASLFATWEARLIEERSKGAAPVEQTPPAGDQPEPDAATGQPS